MRILNLEQGARTASLPGGCCSVAWKMPVAPATVRSN